MHEEKKIPENHLVSTKSHKPSGEPSVAPESHFLAGPKSMCHLGGDLLEVPRLCLAVTGVLLGLLAPLVAQPGPSTGVELSDPGEEAVQEQNSPDRPTVVDPFELFAASGHDEAFLDHGPDGLTVTLWGNASISYEWKGDLVRVFADCIVADASYEKEANEVHAADDPEDTTARDPAEGAAEETEDEAGLRLKPLSFYAEGHVRLQAKDLILATDAFFFDYTRERGVAVRVNGRGTMPSVDRLQAIFSRDNLTLTGRRQFDGDTTMGDNVSPFEPEEEQTSSRREEDGVDRALPLGQRARRQALQVAFRAELLRVVDVHSFVGEDIVISSCEYGVPHFGLHSGSMLITRAGGQEKGAAPGAGGEHDHETHAGGESPVATSSPEGPGETDESPGSHFTIDPQDSWFEFDGLSLLPFPLGYWDTRWLEFNPIRNVAYSSSSKYGDRIEVELNLNWILKQFPESNYKPLDDFLSDSRLDVITDQMSKRGFGHGVQGEYGSHPRKWKAQDIDVNSWDFLDHHGRSLFYGLEDHGEDRTAPIGSPIPDEERHWGTVLHRQRLPYLGVLDVEYSEQSDPNFLREFFPYTQTEKEQESLFYLRRHFGDNVAATGLYKYRTNDFETTRERVPEGKLFVMEQPVFNSGVYTGLNLQAANLRLRPGTTGAEASRDYGRLDLMNEWSYPFGIQDYVRFRPFFAFRFSAYEQGLDPTDTSIQREAFLGGVSASQEWSRVFRTTREGWMRRLFGIRALKHAVVPQLTYSNLWDNDVDSSRLYPFDTVDTVAEQEAVSLSIRNILWARGGRQVRARKSEEGEKQEIGSGRPTRIVRPTRAILDADARFTWFPQPERHNMGDRGSLVDLDVSFAPSRYLLFRSRDFFDPNQDMDLELTDNSVTVRPIPEVLSFTVGERFRAGDSEFIYGRSGVKLSRKYYLEAFGGMDLEIEERTDIEVRLVRFMHRFAVECSYSFDRGEDDNHTVSFNLYPVELFEDFWSRRRYDGVDRLNYRPGQY